MPPRPPLQSLHTPERASLQLASPQVDNSSLMQSQRDGGMEVESCESRNMTNQQQDSASPDTPHSEQLPVTTDQQSRCFTQDKTSVAHDEGHIHLHLQNTTEALEKSGCCMFRFLCN